MPIHVVVEVDYTPESHDPSEPTESGFRFEGSVEERTADALVSVVKAEIKRRCKGG